MEGNDGLYVTEAVAKLTVATSVYNPSFINAKRLSLSIMKRPRSVLFVGNAVSLNV